VDDFLFRTRRGFCEHYTSAFVFLMRAAGVPARVVTGYQGGERNTFGDYLIVRQSDAHAWAEVWLEGRGWTRVDPTGAVAPNRIQEGLYAAVADPDALPFLVRRGGASEWLRQLAMSWDSLNNSWNEWVLAYGPGPAEGVFIGPRLRSGGLGRHDGGDDGGVGRVRSAGRRIPVEKPSSTRPGGPRLSAVLRPARPTRAGAQPPGRTAGVRRAGGRQPAGDRDVGSRNRPTLREIALRPNRLAGGRAPVMRRLVRRFRA
jgi:hypothetical protein